MPQPLSDSLPAPLAVPRSEARFYGRYAWCLNPILSVRELFQRLREELAQAPALELEWQIAETRINLYLFVCAIACTVEDYLARRPPIFPHSSPISLSSGRRHPASRGCSTGRRPCAWLSPIGGLHAGNGSGSGVLTESVTSSSASRNRRAKRGPRSAPPLRRCRLPGFRSDCGVAACRSRRRFATRILRITTSLRWPAGS